MPLQCARQQRQQHAYYTLGQTLQIGEENNI